MIHKLYSLKDHIPTEIIEEHYNRYGLNLNRKEWKVIVVDIHMDEDQASFIGTRLIDYSVKNNVDKFFYWSKTGNVVSSFPTIIVTDEILSVEDKGEDLESASLPKGYAKLIKILNNNAHINPRLETVRNMFVLESQNILKSIRKYTSGSRDPYLLTLCIDGKFIGESEIYKDIRDRAENDIFADFYMLDKKKTTGKDQTCSMCGAVSAETWGYVSIYNFYTSKTDMAPVAGKFDRTRAHICYPVCPVCAGILHKLKPVVDEYLDFRFCGINYKLIPLLTSINGVNSHLKEIFDILMDKSNPKNPKCGSFSLGKNRSLIREQTEDIFHLLAESNSQMSYTMMFYSESNAEFKILSTIEDVFPRQFQDIFRAKANTDKHSIYRDSDLDFRFDVIKEFFPISHPIYGNNAKAFLEVTRNVFNQKPISLSYILHQVMYIIRKRFVRNDFFRPSVLRAFLMLEFMNNLGVINSRTKTRKEVQVNKVYEDFFQEHSSFFDSNEKKAVFLLGVLCQFLLNIQYQERKASPFLKKLNGLKMNSKLLKKLYWQIINKLTEYGKNYYTELETEIGKLLIQDKEISISEDELSFLFALGMRLHKLFKTPETPEAPDENTKEE